MKSWLRRNIGMLVWRIIGILALLGILAILTAAVMNYRGL